MILTLSLLFSTVGGTVHFDTDTRSRPQLGSSRVQAQQGSNVPIGPPPVERTPDAPKWPKDFEMGLNAARLFAYYFGIIEDRAMRDRLHDIGYKIASQSAHPEYLFTFNVIDMPGHNAFALPGGFVFVTKAVMESGLSDDALAHLLGHELAHVTENHHSRSNKVEGILSILETAVFVAALVALPSGQQSTVGYDEYSGDYYRTPSGKEAAVLGTAVFGGLFRALLSRGYSRGLEMEADQVGRRFAGRAGYPMAGGVELMETLQDRIYEDQSYSYWRTHPFFDDRLVKAKTASDAGGSPPVPGQVESYRAEVQARMARIAGSILNEDTSIYLFETALLVGPRGPQSVEVAHDLLQRKTGYERSKAHVLRTLTPLIEDYDSLLTEVFEIDGIPESRIRQLTTERKDLERERGEIHELSLELVDERGAGIRVLETFLENFPEDPRALELRFRLAEVYRLIDRPDESALRLDDLMREVAAPGFSDPNGAEASTWSDRALASMQTTIPHTTDLSTNVKLIESTNSDSVRAWASHRLETLASTLDSLEVGSRFLQHYPDHELAPVVKKRVQSLAQKKYLKARLHESMQRYQSALDEYHRIVFLAPGTEAADRAEEGIDRVQGEIDIGN